MNRLKRAAAIALIALLTLSGLTLPVPGAHASTPTGSSINTHTVMVDDQSKIVSWVPNQDQAYATVAASAWNFLLNNVPTDEHGLPGFYTHSYFNPDTRELSFNPHNPAGTNAMLTESALQYYQYSGDARVLTLVENSVTYHLDHGMTAAGDNWSNVPYASSDYGNTTYAGASRGNSDGVGDGVGVIEPDKVGELGVAFVQLYKITGEQKYLTAAINAANALASHVRAGNATQSPWPFRVKASDNTIKEQYTAHTISPIELLDNLIALGQGNTASYQSARTTAWNWLMQYPMQSNNWSTYFEDVDFHPGANNNTQMNSIMTARYLLQHPEYDANWETHVRGLIAWTEQNFAVPAFGANTIQEQADFAHPMGSHTSRYCDVNALLYQRTGDLAAKEKAYRACNWATYMARDNGVVIDGPEINNAWFTDGYGDFIRGMMVAMGGSPDFAPAGQNHLLQTSSVVTNVTYGPSQLSYSAFEAAGTEVIKVASAPTGVAINGVSLAQRSDLAAEGWTYDAAQSVVRVRRDTGKNVTIALNGTPTNLLPNVSLSTGATTYTAPASFNVTAAASDPDGTITKVEFYQNGALVSTVTTTPYTFAAAALPAGSYAFSARAYDNQNASSNSNTVSVTVNGASQGGTWTGADIGTTGVAGSTAAAGSAITVKGGGTDIWGTADSFQFGYQQMTGDGEIKARVVTQQNTDPWALAGVMIRDTLAPGAKETLAAMTPGHGAAFDYRTATGGSTTYVNGAAATVPYWMRLVRAGTTITASKSTNGTAWTSMGSATVSLGTTAYVGLAVTSHNPSALGTATFDNVSFTGQSTADTTPPVISGISVSGVNPNGATVSWTTSEPATSQIEFGPTTAYGSSTTLNSSLATAHTQVVPDLASATTYHYRVKSADAAANLATSADNTFTTPTPADTQAPSAPTGLTATAISFTQANLNWTAATDNVAVTGYQVFRDGVQIGTATGTTFSDAALTFNTNYTYTVRAVDAAGNVSLDSNAAAITTPTPDTQAPSVPTGLTASVTLPNQVDLSWTAAADDTAVTKYLVKRNGAVIAQPTGTTFSDTTATGGSTYSYVVAAADAAGNTSASSDPATATVPDTTAPTAPVSLTATAVAGPQVNLSWGASSDAVGVTSYLIFRDGQPLDTATGTSYSDANVVTGTTYNYTVEATDAAGNLSAASNTATITPPVPDTQAPTAPTGLTATAVSFTQVNLAWTAATDNIAVTGYQIFRDGAQVGTTTGTTYADTALLAGNSYAYTVRATDAAGNLSPASNTATATTPTPDTTPPSAPSALTATAPTGTQVNLSWTASTDNVGVTRYNVLRGGTQIGTTTSTSYADTTVAAGTSYSYTVTAQDAAGNVSAASNTATVTTPAPVVTLAVDTQVAVHTTTAATTITSPAFTTAGPGELLVAFVSSDGPSGASTFSSVTTTGLTWTLRKRQNTQAGTSEIWTAPAAAKLTNATAKATRTGSYRSSLVVTAFKGADLTTIGATAGASAATGAATASLTTTRAGSWVWAVGNDWDNAVARTVGTAQTKVDEFLTSTGDTLWVQRRTAVTPAAGTVVTINDTAPTADRYNLALIEILPAP
ncbi:MAG TPA: Ig-like domain-containing protein [Candidatus Saccharimonadia bacterium]|nr:Ig-like domain-containing protein [Candidatus Saccharimonadia bacterium]